MSIHVSVFFFRGGGGGGGYKIIANYIVECPESVSQIGNKAALLHLIL